MGAVKAQDTDRSERIRLLNDAARRTFVGAQVVVTAAFADQPTDWKAKALERVRTFNVFDEGNDPHNEHDLAFFDVESERIFFKFDYYGDASYRTGANDPGDPAQTFRCLTIGMASDY